MPLPLFDPVSGYLPSGEHAAVWWEIVDRFAWNPWRRSLLDGLNEAASLLSEAGCARVWLNGSFVTAKEVPEDFDAVWDTDGVNQDSLDPIFFQLEDGRAVQKCRFGGELFPNWLNRSSGSRFSEFFQQDRFGNAKGIVVFDPREVNA